MEGLWNLKHRILLASRVVFVLVNQAVLVIVLWNGVLYSTKLPGEPLPLPWVNRLWFQCHPRHHGRGCVPQPPALQSHCRYERSPRLMGMPELQTAHRRASLSPWSLGCVVQILQETVFCRKRVHLLLFKIIKKTLKNFPSHGASQLFSYSDISLLPQLKLSHKSLKTTDS